jgi:DNA polymerase III gamma/tau subunit
MDTHPDFKEINAADTGGKDQVRQIQRDLKTRPMFGKVKFYILDEAHKMTSAAQEALLKGTEDMSKGVYVVLCSTEPKKIIPTLRNRCEDYNFKSLSNSNIRNLIEIVGLQEGYTVPPTILNAIVSVSAGMPRNALKSLQKALNLAEESEEDILSTINFIDDVEPKVIDLCLMIHGRKRSKWTEIIKKYKSLNMEPQQVNLVLAGWFRSSLERTTPGGNSSSTSFNYAHKLSKVLSYFCEDLPVIRPENKVVLNMYKAFEEFYRG